MEGEQNDPPVKLIRMIGPFPFEIPAFSHFQIQRKAILVHFEPDNLR